MKVWTLKCFLEDDICNRRFYKSVWFLKTYFKMCTNKNKHVPVRPWFHDPYEEEHCGCGYKDDVIHHLNKIFTTKIFFFKIKVKMIQLILSITELNFGLVLLVMLRVGYPIIFMIMNITTKVWMGLFAVQTYFLRLKK